MQRVYVWDPRVGDIETIKLDANALSAAVDAALTQTFGDGTLEFRRYSEATTFHYPLPMAERVPESSVRNSLYHCRERSLKLLGEAVTFLQEEQEFASTAPISPPISPASTPVRISIAIGHGRSSEWLKLEKFLKERLGLPVDEFNSVSVAGVPTIERLSGMLDNAAMAFLLMTAEDEQANGKMRARENVVHEAGLFQGRLGFKRAIVLPELPIVNETS